VGPVVDHPTVFLAVDLELVGDERIPQLIDALANTMFCLTPHDSGQSVWCLELRSASTHLQPDLVRMVDALCRLPPDLRTILAACSRKQVNVGIQAGAGAKSYEFAVAPDVLATLASLDVSFAVTVYAVESVDGGTRFVVSSRCG
jgi:hypothetical protein